MDKANMANNTETVRVDGTRYRKIPNFSNYGISAHGAVINLTTKNELMTKDNDHWSGRVTLYRTSKHGDRVARTFNIMDLLRMTYSSQWCENIAMQYGPLTNA